MRDNIISESHKALRELHDLIVEVSSALDVADSVGETTKDQFDFVIDEIIADVRIHKILPVIITFQ